MKESNEMQHGDNWSNPVDPDDLSFDPDELPWELGDFGLSADVLERSYERMRTGGLRREPDFDELSDEERQVYQKAADEVDRVVSLISKFDEDRKKDEKSPDVLTRRERNTILERFSSFHGAVKIINAFEDMGKLE